MSPLMNDDELGQIEKPALDFFCRGFSILPHKQMLEFLQELNRKDHGLVPRIMVRSALVRIQDPYGDPLGDSRQGLKSLARFLKDPGFPNRSAQLSGGTRFRIPIANHEPLLASADLRCEQTRDGCREESRPSPSARPGTHKLNPLPNRPLPNRPLPNHPLPNRPLPKRWAAGSG